MGGEDGRQAPLGGQVHGRREEERVHGLRGTQVIGRNPGHLPADLDQRALQRAGLAGEQRAATVGGQLAIPGEQTDQHEADSVDHDAHRHERDHDERGILVVATAAAAAEKLAVESEPDQQGGDDGQERRGRHDLDILVRYVRHLVRDDTLKLLWGQPAHQVIGHAEHRVVGAAPSREGVRHIRVGDGHPGFRHVRQRAEPVHDAVQLRCLLRGDLAGPGRPQGDLVRVKQRPDGETAAEDHREKHDRGVGCVICGPDADDRGDECDKHQPEQEHGRGHPHRQSPVGCIPGTRRHGATSVRPRLVLPPGASSIM